MWINVSAFKGPLLNGAIVCRYSIKDKICPVESNHELSPGFLQTENSLNPFRLLISRVQ